VFGRVAMGISIRAGGIDEGAGGVTNFYPAKIWALAGIHLVLVIKRALVENYLLTKLGSLPGALSSPYLVLGLVLGFFLGRGGVL
jgi:hypothetical protein